jgi:chemotaxis response regulator CheB
MEQFQGVNEHGDLHIRGHIFHLHNLKNWSKADFKKVFAGKLQVDMDLVWDKIEKGIQEMAKQEHRRLNPNKLEKAPKKTKVEKAIKTK